MNTNVSTQTPMYKQMFQLNLICITPQFLGLGLPCPSIVPLQWLALRSFIQTISIAPLQVHYYSEALPTQHGYCAGVSRRSTTGNCELRTCPRSLRGG